MGARTRTPQLSRPFCSDGPEQVRCGPDTRAGPRRDRSNHRLGRPSALFRRLESLVTCSCRRSSRVVGRVATTPGRTSRRLFRSSRPERKARAPAHLHDAHLRHAHDGSGGPTPRTSSDRPDRDARRRSAGKSITHPATRRPCTSIAPGSPLNTVCEVVGDGVDELLVERGQVGDDECVVSGRADTPSAAAAWPSDVCCQGSPSCPS